MASEDTGQVKIHRDVSLRSLSFEVSLRSESLWFYFLGRLRYLSISENFLGELFLYMSQLYLAASWLDPGGFRDLSTVRRFSDFVIVVLV